MPGRDGYQVARHIRDTPRLAHIPVVLLTGAFEPIDQAKAAAVGCDGVLAKPFEPQQVIGRVRELLARPRDPGNSPAPLKLATAASGDAWTLPSDLPLQPLQGEPRAASSSAATDAYFDQLDEAFASLGGGRAEASAPVPSGRDPMDWFSATPSAPASPEAIVLEPIAPEDASDFFASSAPPAAAPASAAPAVSAHAA